MIGKLKKYSFTKNSLKKAPEEPGVYIFYNKSDNIIYIGKARSLRNRLRNYFNINIIGKTDRLVKKIKSMSFIKVGSEIEAILLEAKLIKYYQPYYNVALKDDKSQLYVFITEEQYPRLITGRKSQIKVGYKYSFGPFINTSVFYSILKTLRKIIPYSTHLPSKRTCLYHQLDLCNPCPSNIEMVKDAKEKDVLLSLYASNIQNLLKFFRGKFGYLKKEFLKEMTYYSNRQEFEKANIYKNKLQYLDVLLTPPDITEKYTDDPHYLSIIRKKERRELERLFYIHLNKKYSIKRIECYDISHIQGSQSTGSMVTFIN